MPLDLGEVTEFTSVSAGADMGGTFGAGAHPSDKAQTIGAALRAAREFRGLSLQDLADATRIRRGYLAAIEDMKIDLLPSRPFAIGYVRACAQVLGMDPDEAVTRFKHDAPTKSEPLRPPVGVRRERDPRFSFVAGGAGLVLSAFLVWNIAQHAMADDGPPAPTVPEMMVAGAPPVSHAGPVVLTAAEPAPPESGVPAPYVTPGLKPGAGIAQTAVAQATPAAAPAPAVFSPKGLVYGASAAESAIILQARKAASIIVRGADGTVYFARQLAAGEAYRAPAAMRGLTVDVSDPLAFDVYSNGELKGPLTANQMPIGRLAG